MNDDIESSVRGLASQSAKRAGKKILSQIVIAVAPVVGVVLCILLIAAVVYAVSVSMMNFVKNVDITNNKFDTSSGITGQKFYGARVIYEDNEESSLLLKDTYLDFTYDILSNANNIMELTININNADLTNKDAFIGNEKVIELTYVYAYQICNQGASLIERTTYIDHFGFTGTEKTNVLIAISNYLTTNSYVNISSECDYSDALSALTATYNACCKYMDNISDKTLVKDYLTTDDEMVSGLNKKNYKSYIFMPKSNVEISSTEFMFSIDNEKLVEVKQYLKVGPSFLELTSATADSTWFNSDYPETTLIYNPENKISLPEFTAIDKNNLDYLKTPKTIFHLKKDNNYSLYFNNSSSNIVENINSSNCLLLTFVADSPFYMAEFETKF